MRLVSPQVRRYSSVQAAGHFRLTVRAPGGSSVNLSMFRGKPTTIGSYAFADPFGPESFSFTLPQVTIFDRRGSGDLSWCVKDADVDLEWIGPLPRNYFWPKLRWEGYLVDFSYSEDGLELTATGAMHQLDGTLAKPSYPARPLPYEWAIARCFQNDPSLRLAGLQMRWPDWWKVIYSDPDKGTPAYMIPTGVKSGDQWSDMLTRSTGSWNPTLTGFIQSLLSSMYTERGRFALDLFPGRVPVLLHRDLLFSAGPDIPVVDLASPGVKHTLAEDHSQSTTTLFGQGTSLSGVGYSGMQISSDGQVTSYRPLASTRQTWPRSDDNGWYDPAHMRREVMLQLQAGLDEDQAVKVAVAHQQRFGDPGLTGTITLSTDPRLPDGTVVPRHLIRAGMDVQVPYIFGDPDGMVLHVASSSADITGGTNTLTVDSKSRDSLTVNEVRLRGRDAMSVTRLLVAGGYRPPLPDDLLPWNYAEGSGCLPSGPQLSSLRLFSGMPDSVNFPWDSWTRARPPKDAAWRSCYAHIGPADVNANKNWTELGHADGSQSALPIKMSQQGTIRLLQLAAYDGDGNVMPVDFHVSFYYVSGANHGSTPALLAEFEAKYPPYKAGQHYPFFPSAWEKYNDDGTQTKPYNGNAWDSAGYLRGYGSLYEKAGHWPGSFAAGDPPTGLLVDESSWGFDCTKTGNFTPYAANDNANNPMAGQIYMLIYCDAQKNKDVYFAGRLFRSEPGTTTTSG